MYICIFHLMPVLHIIQKWLKCTISQSSEGQIQMTLHSCGVQWPLLHRGSFSCFGSSLTSINIFVRTFFLLLFRSSWTPPGPVTQIFTDLLSHVWTGDKITREHRRVSCAPQKQRDNFPGTNQSVWLSRMTNVALTSFHSSEHPWMERSVVNAKTPPVTPPQRTGTQKAKKFRHLSDVMRGLEICRYSTFIWRDLPGVRLIPAFNAGWETSERRPMSGEGPLSPSLALSLFISIPVLH